MTGAIFFLVQKRQSNALHIDVQGKCRCVSSRVFWVQWTVWGRHGSYECNGQCGVVTGLMSAMDNVGSSRVLWVQWAVWGRHGSYECNVQCGVVTAEQWQRTANVTVPNSNVLYNIHRILWQRDWFLLTSNCRKRATVVWQRRWRTRLCSGPFNTTTSYFTGWLVQMLNNPQLEAVTAFVYLYYKITSNYKDYLKCWKVPHSRLWMGSFPYSMKHLVILWKDIFWMVCHYMAWLVSFRYSMKQPAKLLII